MVVIKPLGRMLNQAAVTCQRMSAHHDSATFLAAAHVLPVPDQQAAVDGTCVLTLFTLMGRICLLNWTVSGCIFPPHSFLQPLTNPL